MNLRRVLLCWSVAVSFGILFTTCTKGDDRALSAAKQLSPTGLNVGAARNGSPDELVADRIRTRIEAACVVKDFRAYCEPIYASEALPGFYVRRLYRPAWSDKRGPTGLVDDLLSSIRRADLEGLRPKDYHLSAIETLLGVVRAGVGNGGTIVPDQVAELDLLLTDAFLVYGSHLLAGRVNPETLHLEWVVNRRTADLASVLETALTSGDISGALTRLTPSQRGFRRLCEALEYHRAVVAGGGWPLIPDGVTLKPGDQGPSVTTLRERLRLGGDLGGARQEGAVIFDAEIKQALKRFQRRYGLKETGTMDAVTRAELNVSAERRVEQVELNLERWRWLPQDLGRRHICVNIAAFNLEVVEDEAVVLAMRVVVGKPYHSTPVFSDMIRYIVLNPYWNVPSHIAEKEMLPRIKRDRSYLTRENLKVFQGWGSEGREVDPAKVNWSAITPANFPFHFRQQPGPSNALGRIKFMFPNKFNIYLHDTPARPLFEETQRDFSHGCIRIQKPIELALYLFQQDPRWSREAFSRALEEAVDRIVPLPEPIPIHMLYFTAWVDADGTIQFRRDIYGQDELLAAALRVPPSTKE